MDEVIQNFCIVNKRTQTGKVSDRLDGRGMENVEKRWKWIKI